MKVYFFMYVRSPDVDSNVPLPILYDGEVLWLDDALVLLNNSLHQYRLCRLEIYADGSCNQKECVGAWAVVSDNFKCSGVVESDNIGYVELYAVYKALVFAQRYSGDVVIYTDSQYVYSNVNWKAKRYESLGWKSKGWRKRISNKMLLQKIVPLLGSNVRVEKISRRRNKCADGLARATLKKHIR